MIRADGTFDIDGTYRVEVGPISIEPAPPAHFSGSMAGAGLILTVVATAGSLQPASYSMTPRVPGRAPFRACSCELATRCRFSMTKSVSAASNP
jgi:hypothetical protein